MVKIVKKHRCVSVDKCHLRVIKAFLTFIRRNRRSQNVLSGGHIGPFIRIIKGTDCAENTGAAAFCSKNTSRGIPCVPYIQCPKIVICMNPCNLWFVPTSDYIPLPWEGLGVGLL